MFLIGDQLHTKKGSICGIVTRYKADLSYYFIENENLSYAGWHKASDMRICDGPLYSPAHTNAE